METPKYSYIITVVDEESGEHTQLFTQEKSVLNMTVNRLQSNPYTIVTVQNLGVLQDAFDFLKELKNNDNLEFGNGDKQ